MAIASQRRASVVRFRALGLATSGWIKELTIAFIGDQGLSASAQAVLQLIRDEGADAVVHAGDFDYVDDPAAWDAQIDVILGTAGDGFHDLYLRDRLAEDDSLWRISAWHRNMRLLQVGGKDDDTGWGVYEESRRGGAIIATAHEHSYSRTHLLSHVETQAVASTSDTLVLAADDPFTSPDEGRSFVFVSALAGRSIRSQSLSGPW